MKEKTSALFSEFIIDGVRQSLTPAQMLAPCASEGALPVPDGPYAPLVDETLDISPSAFTYDEKDIDDYLARTLEVADGRKCLPVAFAGPYTAAQVAQTLLEALLRSGHFRLEDLSLRAEWRWDRAPIGNVAAFYDSVEAAGEFIDQLGLTLSSVSCLPAKECSAVFRTGIAGLPEADDELLPEDPQEVRIGRKRRHPAQLLSDPESWIVYIPFDTCAYRLGGSALSRALDARSPVAPDIGDADYFIDCFEVVRELVEDGIVRAGTPVGEGGLITALRRMCTPETGARISLADLRTAFPDATAVQLLFAEVPGVLLQIDDLDYDYLDAEFLLQDVAWFPLGHPVAGGSLSVGTGSKTGVQGILESLLNSQASEGED